jgi:hypothetical protein
MTDNNICIPIPTIVDNRKVEGATALSIAQHTVEPFLATVTSTSKPLSSSTNDLLIDNRASLPPTAMDVKKVLDSASGAVEAMDLHATWQNAFTKIRWVMDRLGPVAEVCALSIMV